MLRACITLVLALPLRLMSLGGSPKLIFTPQFTSSLNAFASMTWVECHVLQSLDVFSFRHPGQHHHASLAQLGDVGGLYV